MWMWKQFLLNDSPPLLQAFHFQQFIFMISKESELKNRQTILINILLNNLKDWQILVLRVKKLRIEN